MTSTFLFLLILQAPRTPSCDVKDLACSARATAAAANDPTIPADQRVPHFLAAGRAYLRLFRETGQTQDLCAARRYIALGSKDPGHPFAPRLAQTRAEITAELGRAQVVCEAPRSAGPPVALAALPVDRSPEPSPTEVPLGAFAPTAAHVPTAPTRPSATARPQPVARTFSTAPRRDAATRTGLGLLAAGGSGLVLAGSLGGVAGLAVAERDRVVADGRALGLRAQAQGYTDPETEARRRELTVDASRWHRTLVVTSVAAGVVGSVAIALIAAGAHRRLRRPSRRVALHPTGLGLLLNARF